jgi:hypothetical protein
MRVIAFYLPQYHPIPENDQWWGKGFTEWTNVAKARPLFRGHYQPHLPADLGYYDLRVPEVREEQAKMAKNYGIEGFCYWHYWFGNGVRILERPFNEVLSSGKPDFPFCLGWANETWTGIWHGSPNRILIEQKYPGWDDYMKHFDFLLRAFNDSRYIRVDGKPLLFIYRPNSIPDCRKVMDYWRTLATKSGLPGLHLVAETFTDKWVPYDYGFDGATIFVRLSPPRKFYGCNRLMEYLISHILLKKPHIFEYKDIMPYMIKHNVNWEYYPSVLPNWDNTPRSGINGRVLRNSSPELFRVHLREAIAIIQNYAANRRILFIKSWNEWAEGNHLEPDQKFGLGYLEVLRDELAAVK